jgi:excisionase family DNA binding protein
MPRAKYDSPVMTVKEVAHYLQVHPSTIYRLLKRGTIPCFRVGSDWRFRKADMDAWLQLLARGEVKAST